MSAATILKSPQEQIKDIQNYDRNILVESLLTSPKDLESQYNFFESIKNLPGANSKLITNLQSRLFQIMVEKIKLTENVLGVNGNIATIIPNPQLNLNLEDVQEVKESEEEEIKPEEQMAKTEVKDNVIKHDFNKKNNKVDLKVINKDVDRVKNQKKNLTIEQIADNGNVTVITPNSTTHGPKETVSTSFKYFQGYTRKKIFGTAEELPKGVQDLVLVADSESKIDEIATMLVLEGRTEDALNLSIDLFEEKKLKERAEVEKRFLFEVLPYIKQVKITEPKDYQKLSLSLWIQYLDDIKDLEKTIEEVSSKLAEEVKEKGYLSLKVQSIINTYSIETILEDKLIAKIAEKSEKKVEDLEWEAFNESDVDMLTKVNKKSVIIKKEAETPITTVGLTYETLQNECISMFKANPDPKTAFKEVKAFFDKEIVNVVDEGFDKTDKGLFAKLVIEFKKSQKTVEEAEKAAYEGKDEIAPEVKNEAKSIVKKTIETGGYIVNELRKFFSQKAYRNVLGKKKIEDFAKELETEVKTENPELANKPKERVKIMTNLSIENSAPDVWESAKLCKTLTEFKDLLINIVFEKKEITVLVKDKPKSINGWEVASNLMEQYGNNFEETKEWTSEKKAAFFNGIINATSEERKKAKEANKVEESTENKQEQIEVQRSESSTTTQPTTKTVENPQESAQIVDMKKFDAISTLSNVNKIHELMAEFLLLSTYKTYQDRFNELRDNYLPKNKKWSGTKPTDRENTINKVIKNNPKIQELIK